MTPRELPEEFVAALGRVTSSFAFLESSLAFLAWTLISPDQFVGQIVTARLSFGNVVELVGALFHHRVKDQALRDELDAVLKRALEVEEKRNRVTHSTWGLGVNSDTIVRMKITRNRRKGLDRQDEEVDAAHLLAIAKQAQNVARDVTGFLDKFATPVKARG